jgi:quercetin 2,3-dioxygenase
MRSVKHIHDPESSPIDDLITHRVLPTRSLNYIDPFLFLNHHGPQTYPPRNKGLPFGPHPHRGIETVTFIIEGDIVHKDNSGHKSTIGAGGIQWMTAGRGLIHSEVSSDEFKQNGGPLEILQLWINLPAKHKMTAPFYKGLQKEEIPLVNDAGHLCKVSVISGKYGSTKGAITSVSEIDLYLVELEPAGEFNVTIPVQNNVFCYLVKGEADVNSHVLNRRQLAEFANDSEGVTIRATESATIIFGHARPFNEPVVAAGPFVMNTDEEIDQAYQDYHAGKFGTWKD